MQYRTLGNTGVRISEIGLASEGGGVLAGGSGTQVRDTVERAIELGVSYFEADGDAYQSRLGSALRDLGVRPLIASSIQLTSDDLSDLSGRIESSVDATLGRLQVDILDFLNLMPDVAPSRSKVQKGIARTLTLEDLLETEGVAGEGLQQVISAGKVRFLGLTLAGGDIAAATELLNAVRFSLVSVVYNLLNPSALVAIRNVNIEPDFGQIIRFAEAKGAGIVVRNPLGFGELSEANTTNPPSRSGKRYRKTAGESGPAGAFGFLSIPERQSMAQAAIRFALMEPAVTTVLPELSNLEQMDEVLAGASAGPLTEQQMTRIGMIWRAGLTAPTKTATRAPARTPRGQV